MFALRGLRIGGLGLLRQFGAQLIGLPHQVSRLLVFLPAGSLAGLCFELRDLRHRLLGLLAGVFAALGLAGLAAGHLSGQIHCILRQLPRLLEFATGQGLPGLALVFGNLVLAILGCLVLRHALTPDVADPLLGRH